jgi:hypothetical protein
MHLPLDFDMRFNWFQYLSRKLEKDITDNKLVESVRNKMAKQPPKKIRISR